MRCEVKAWYRLISEWAPLAPIAPAMFDPGKDIPKSREPAATMSRSYLIIHDRSSSASPSCGPSRTLLVSKLRKAPQTHVPK